MVLYGQSAGAGAVLSYAYSYPADPIVTGFIASSGGASANNSAAMNSGFQKIAQDVGCANLTDKAELECMQRVDPVVLREAVVVSRTGFRPVVDNTTMFVNLTERHEKGLVSKQPLITGFTFNEPAAFAQLNENGTESLNTTQGMPGGGPSCGAKREALCVPYPSLIQLNCEITATYTLRVGFVPSTASQHTAICIRATSPTSRLGRGLVACTAVSVNALDDMAMLTKSLSYSGYPCCLRHSPSLPR